MSTPDSQPPPTFGVLFARALALRCPRCGGGKLFRGYFRMYPECPNCKLRYERAPGYFLGSAYINYGLTGGIITVAYMALHFGADVSNDVLLYALGAFAILFPLFFFRYARSLWLAMDSFFDRTDFEED